MEECVYSSKACATLLKPGLSLEETLYNAPLTCACTLVCKRGSGALCSGSAAPPL